MKFFAKTVSYATFLTTLVASVPTLAQDVDFSCMREQVRSIIQVTDQHQEFDVVMRNECPGAVYWATCIERMDPWTHRVIETHTPSGYVEDGKRARVNLQMKNTPRESLAEGRIEEFYVSYAYALDRAPRAACVARACEAKKTELRAQATANDKAWAAARASLAAQLESECPATGWATADVDACRELVAAARAEELGVFEATDAALQERLQAIDPAACSVHGGGRNTIK